MGEEQKENGGCACPFLPQLFPRFPQLTTASTESRMALHVGNSRENPDLQFVELRKVRVANAVAPDVSNGIVVSEAFGVLFAISNDSRVDVLSEQRVFDFQWSKSVINQTADANPITAFNTHFKATFLSVSLTGRVLLASGVTGTPGSTELTFYDVQQIAETRTAAAFANVSIPGKGGEAKRVICADWHPEFAESLLIVCFTDGSVSTIAVDVNTKTSAQLADYFVNPGITSVSWSPKGKQVLMAKANGCITFYKHHNGTGFAEARNIAPPDELKSFSVSSIKWITSTVIMACFVDPNNDQDANTRYVLVTAPTKSLPEYFDYGRIVMDMAEYKSSDRNYTSSFSLIGNMILATTSHSSEVSVIGCENVAASSHAAAWDQFILEDSSRIELPMSGSSDTFCRGSSFTLSSLKPFRLNENEIYGGPGTPCLYILTSAGVICPYYVVHKKNLIQPLAPALPLQQLQFTGVQNPVPAPQTNERFPSPNNLTFCPPSHSTPSSKPANAFGLKPATFGSGQPLSQPITETPLSSISKAANPIRPANQPASGLASDSGSNVFGSKPLAAPQQSMTTASSFSFGAAASALNSETESGGEERRPSAAVDQKADAIRSKEVTAAAAPVRDIPLEEAQKEIASMQNLIAEHKDRVRSFLGQRRIDDEACTNHFTSECSRLSRDFQVIDQLMSDSRVDIKALKGWIGQDFEALAAAERKLNKLKDDKFTRSISSYKLDSLTAQRLNEVKQRSRVIEDQLRLVSESLKSDWNTFIESANGSQRNTDRVTIIKKAISDCSHALIALDKSVAGIEAKVCL